MERIDFKTGTFYQGDCFDVLAALTPGSIDMILNDPPYGTTACAWDSVLPLPDMWAAYWRALKTNGPAVITASQPFTSALISSQTERFKYEIIWQKSIATNFMRAGKEPTKKHENICVFARASPTYLPIMEEGKPYSDKARSRTVGVHGGKETVKKPIENAGTRYPSSIQFFANSNNHTFHPTQKPVALFEYLIKTYTNPGELVLDPTAGSGTTAVAAIQAGRRWVCVERDPEYFFKACARVYEAEAAV